MPRTVPTTPPTYALRRLATRIVTLALALSSGLVLAGPAVAGTAPEHRPSDDVNLLVGSMAGQPDFGTGGGAGNTYPGAQRPFGMLAWSPDTYPSTDNYASGYTYTDTRIRGFSLTHLSGPGCAVFGDVPILPTTRPVTSSPVSPGSSAIDPAYLASFDHEHESARPGAYDVTLNPDTDSPIEVALAADTRSGVGSFTFPARKDAGFLVNVGGVSWPPAQPRSRSTRSVASSRAR